MTDEKTLSQNDLNIAVIMEKLKTIESKMDSVDEISIISQKILTIESDIKNIKDRLERDINKCDKCEIKFVMAETYKADIGTIKKFLYGSISSIIIASIYAAFKVIK
jgi:hypothetical protein